mgnify:CR=1 FL=1
MKIECLHLKPFGNMIAIEFDRFDVSKGGLLMPDGIAASFPVRPGRVVEVGDGAFFDNGTQRRISLKIGDRVAAAGVGAVTSVNGSDVELINVDNVLAVIW